VVLLQAEKGCRDVGELKVEFEELIIADAPIEISGFGSDEIDQIVIAETKMDRRLPFCRLWTAPPPLRGSAICSCSARTAWSAETRPIPTSSNGWRGTDVARMVFTDAPFHVAVEGSVRPSNHREDAMVSAEMTEADFLELNENWMKAVSRTW
jgi:hypothetical protein